jgi:hypothetical protein
MKPKRRLCAAAAIITSCLCGLAPQARAQATPPSCSPPASITSQDPKGYAQTAWGLFVAANCTATGNQLTWQTWTDQNSFFGQPGAQPSIHRSRLQMFGPPKSLTESNACPNPPSYMTGAKVPPSNPCQPSAVAPPLKPFVPANLAQGAVFSEDVYVNAAEVAYMKANHLTTLEGQAQYSKVNPITTVIDFPTAAIEVKADWIPATSLCNPSQPVTPCTGPGFTCSNPPADVYVQQQPDGSCFALASIHFSSKLLHDWLWATFEAPSHITNPNRCNPKLYSQCTDEWGVTPSSVSKWDTPTIPTKGLEALFSGAQGKFPAVLQKYRLTGVQTKYMKGSTPTLLGSSFTEFNAQVPVLHASCITCHAGAQVSTNVSAKGGVSSIGQFHGGFLVKMTGQPQTYPQPAGGGVWKTEDFSWMLAIMPAK